MKRVVGLRLRVILVFNMLGLYLEQVSESRQFAQGHFGKMR